MNGDTRTRPGTCWVLSDGKAGTESQCLGLAEALGFDPDIKRLEIRAPWRWLPPKLWLHPLAAIAESGDILAPPWPAFLIAGGRRAVAPAQAIGRASRGSCFTIAVQNPTLDPGRFDAVVAPEHDRLSGANVIVTKGALTRVTEARLADAKAKFGPRYAALPRPLVAVLIGGSSKVHRLTGAVMTRLIAQLTTLSQSTGAGLLVTASRRTGAANMARLRQGLRNLPAEIWDGRDDNPYFGYLALADILVVTSDSVTMVSEAASTGKPVYIVDLEGGSEKFRWFHDAFRSAGITRPFTGGLETWTYQRLDESTRVAQEIRRICQNRRLADKTL